jgi:hypothetical protein
MDGTRVSLARLPFKKSSGAIREEQQLRGREMEQCGEQVAGTAIRLHPLSRCKCAEVGDGCEQMWACVSARVSSQSAACWRDEHSNPLFCFPVIFARMRRTNEGDGRATDGLSE